MLQLFGNELNKVELFYFARCALQSEKNVTFLNYIRLIFLQLHSHTGGVKELHGVAGLLQFFQLSAFISLPSLFSFCFLAAVCVNYLHEHLK